MNFRRSIALGSMLALFAVAACSEEVLDGTPVPEGSEDGGGSKPNPTKDGGTTPMTDGGMTPIDPDAGPTGMATKIADGEIALLGEIEDMAVYLTFGTKITLSVAPIGGGAATVLNADVKLAGDPTTDDSFQISGGVLGIWTGQNPQGLSKLQVWTKANNLKELSTTAPADDSIAGSKDGSRVAFIRNVGSVQEIALANTNLTGTPTVVEPALKRGNSATQCQPRFRFADKYLFTMSCTSTGTTAKLRRSLDGTVTQLALGLDPDSMDITAAGDKVVATTRLTPTAGGIATIYSISAADVVTTRSIENNVTAAYIDPLGAFAVYSTRGGDLKRADALGVTNVNLTSGIKGILSVSNDAKFVTSNKLDETTAGVDIQLSGTSAAATPVSLVATTKGIPVAFTTSGSHYLYIADKAMGKLLARPSAGGADRDLGAVTGLALMDGAKVLLQSNTRKIKVGTADVEVSDFSVVDLATAAAPVLVVKDAQFAEVSGGKILYSESAGGLFSKPLP